MNPKTAILCAGPPLVLLSLPPSFGARSRVAGMECGTPHCPKLADMATLRRVQPEYGSMSIGTILLIILVLIRIGVIPTWPHSRNWGYAPGGIVGVVLIILLILFLMGRI
jgi:hypothetical protein